MANEKYQIEVTIQGKDQISQTIDKTNNSLKSLNQNVRETSNQGRSLGQSFGTLNGVLGQFGIGLSIAGIGLATQQLNELGRTVNAVETTFTEISGGTNAAAQSLSHLRQITGGVINDLELMRGANSLLVTGVASTNEQAAELVNLGSRLGASLGRDATESIENLNAALLNNSFVRLDTLGISASRVRERVNELKEAGLDMSAAFSQAVVEIGTQTLEDLGAGAAVSETAIGRLTTQLQNMGQSLASFVNEQLETAATTLEQIIFLADYGLNGAPLTPIEESAVSILSRANVELEAMVYNQNQLAEARREAEKIAPLVAADSDLITPFAGQGSLVSALTETDSGAQFGTSFGASNAGNRRTAALDVLEALGYNVDTLSQESLLEIAANVDLAIDAVTASSADLEAQAQDTADSLAVQERSLTTMTNANADYRKSLDNMSAGLSDIERDFSNLSDTFQSGMRSSGGLSFFDPAQLQQVTDEAQLLVDEYERLKELGESSEFTLVSQEEVERARLIAQEAESFATQAERGATAFANASLSQLAGQTGGGVLGDLTDLVLGNIEDEGLRASTEQALNLASGRETDLSIALEEDIAPTIAAIADVYGEEAAVVAAQAAADAIALGVQNGLSQSEIIVAAQQATGFELVEGTGQEISVQAGDSLSAISARTGISVEELRAANQGSSLIYPGQILEVGDGTQLIAVAGGSADLATAGISAVDFINPSLIPANLSGPVSQDAGGGGITGPTSLDAAEQLQEQTLILEESITNVESRMLDLASDNPLSELATPFLDGLELAGGEIDSITTSLGNLQEMDFSLQMPIEAIFVGFAADVLARNPEFARAVNIVSANSAGTTATGGGR